MVESKFIILALFYFVFRRAIFQVQAPGGLIFGGRFNGGFFALPVWGAYTWRGLFSEFFGNSLSFRSSHKKFDVWPRPPPVWSTILELLEFTLLSNKVKSGSEFESHWPVLISAEKNNVSRNLFCLESFESPRSFKKRRRVNFGNFSGNFKIETTRWKAYVLVKEILCPP